MDAQIVNILIKSALAIIMLGVGLSLTAKDFKNIIIFPKALIIGLSAQMLVMPILAFFIAWFSPLPLELKVGIVIVSVCPGGASSNLITHLLRGRVALSISMTTMNSVITLVSIPFIVNLALVGFLGEGTAIKLPFWETVAQIFLITILPASLGVLIRAIHADFAKKTERPLKFILPIILASVFAIKFFAGKQSGGSGITTEDIFGIMPYVLSLNIIGMILGFAIAKFLRLGKLNQLTIAIEVGLQNTALALLVAGTLLQKPTMEKPALVYAMFTFFTTILFGIIFKKLNKLRFTEANYNEIKAKSK